MSDANDTTNVPHIFVIIEFNEGPSFTFKCPYSFYGQYVTHGHSVFLEALSRTEGWLTLDDIEGVFHAIPIGNIKAVHTSVAKANE